MPSDEELMAAVAGGSGDAFQELYRRWEGPLHRFVHRSTGGRDAEDLVQETWLRVVRAAARYDPGRRFSTWLFQIAVNLCRDWHRRPPPAPAGAEPAAAASAAVAEAAIDARRLVAALPDAQRSALVLRYYHDLGEAEIADILGCPRGTVKSRLHHAVATLAARVREDPR
jgi:RNA polymerase sigma-70 factor (ECF subfamily)